MPESIEKPKITGEIRSGVFTIAEFARALGIPLVLGLKLIQWGLIKGIDVIDGTIHVTESGLKEGKEIVKNPYRRISLYWKSLGPGLITGASDDDPSGIATYSSVGAKFGLSLLWMSAWLLPMMMAVQEACARIGIVTNKGLTGVLLKYYKKYIVAMIVILLVIANVANIGADIGAMSAAVTMLVNINFMYAAIAFTALIVILEIWVPYQKYAQILKWLSLVLFAYVVTVFIIHPDWLNIFKFLFKPSFKFSKEYIFAMIAFFGTTITPYLFFWQASEEVEEGRLEPGTAHDLRAPKKREKRIVAMRNDVKSGMIFSNLITIFIVVTAAEVLFKNGVTSIDTAQQAASALRPLAGNYAYVLFAAGIIGMGIMAVPVLAGACAYALAEIMGWKEGLSNKFQQAKAFYLIIAVSVIVGMLLNFLGVNPITALYYAAWLNGVIALPLMIVIMVVGNNKKIMGSETHPKWVKFFGWLAVAGMSVGLIMTILLSWGPFAK